MFPRTWSSVRAASVATCVTLVAAGLAVAGAAAPASAAPATSAPFSECPAVGADTGCGVLVVVTNSGVSVESDPSQGPYDGVEDTLIGVVNTSTHPIGALALHSAVPSLSCTGGTWSFSGPGSRSARSGRHPRAKRPGSKGCCRRWRPGACRHG